MSIVVSEHGSPTGAALLERMLEFIECHPRLLVISGAGCSTASGIPDYRDGDGQWKRRQPIRYQEFMGSLHQRRRYWARSLLGWPLIQAATPNPAHRALVELEARGRMHWLVTQNVDGLHQRAGSRRVTDLHGRLDRVACVDCGRRLPREALQEQLERLNPDWRPASALAAPDGDAELEGADFASFRVPLCGCGGILKPDVVFYGENVPRPRVEQIFARQGEASALLVVGSSLMVWSSYRFVRAAVAAGQPVAAVNMGRTRADGELALKLEVACGEFLPQLVAAL